MVVAKQSPYEEFRLRRLEENKKRMEALNLPNLCQTLRLTSVKTSPVLILVFSPFFYTSLQMIDWLNIWVFVYKSGRWRSQIWQERNSSWLFVDLAVSQMLLLLLLFTKKQVSWLIFFLKTVLVSLINLGFLIFVLFSNQKVVVQRVHLPRRWNYRTRFLLVVKL